MEENFAVSAVSAVDGLAAVSGVFDNVDAVAARANMALSAAELEKRQTIIPAVKELHAIFKALNDRFFGGALETPVITIQSKGKIDCFGWFTTDRRWTDADGRGHYEINISAESLGRPIEMTAETLHHEMVHEYNALNEIKDCSRGGRYHNAKFKAAAESHGLICDEMQDSKIGFGHTVASGETLQFYHEQAWDALMLQRAADVKKPTKKAVSFRYVCPQCGAIVRATKQVNVVCGDCDMQMLLDE